MHASRQERPALMLLGLRRGPEGGLLLPGAVRDPAGGDGVGGAVEAGWNTLSGVGCDPERIMQAIGAFNPAMR